MWLSNDVMEFLKNADESCSDINYTRDILFDDGYFEATYTDKDTGEEILKIGCF